MPLLNATFNTLDLVGRGIDFLKGRDVFLAILEKSSSKSSAKGLLCNLTICGVEYAVESTVLIQQYRICNSEAGLKIV